MAKKQQNESVKAKSKRSSSSFFSFLRIIGVLISMRKIFFLLIALAGAYCFHILYPQYIESFHEQIQTRITGAIKSELEIDTFEIHTSEDEIIAKTSKMLPSEKYSLGAHHVLYTPCLLVEAKYSAKNRVTETSHMIWDLLEGEMILSLDSFQETSGFYDFLQSRADIDDFRLLHLLSQQGGTTSKEILVQSSGLDEDKAAAVIHSLQNRHLITVTNHMVRLHVKSPLFHVDPQTKMSRYIVHRRIKKLDMVSEVFSPHQIRSLIQSAYGKDIAILDSKMLWIPVWQIEIINPDGSSRRLFWNAISGKEVNPRSVKILAKHML